MATEQDILATPFDSALEAKPTLEQRLARVRSEKEKREAAADEERKLAEVERFELVERFERETGGGREGREFALVDVSNLGEGFIVVRLGESVHWKTYSNSKMTEADTDVFVVPCLVYPSRDAYRSLVARRAFVGQLAATALAGLYGLKVGDDQKK